MGRGNRPKKIDEGPGPTLRPLPAAGTRNCAPRVPEKNSRPRPRAGEPLGFAYGRRTSRLAQESVSRRRRRGSRERAIVVDYQDMQEEYKDIEDIDDIPMFSGDHWAASIAAKRLEMQKKEDAASSKEGKKKGEDDKGGGEGSSATGELKDSSKDGLLNQV